jgi:CelD/BcsL family acetyltransferase involved in cellulose biosynthesis
VTSVALPFRVGTRTLWQVRRRLVRVQLTLERALAGSLPALPPLAPEADGYFIHSLPAAALEPLARGEPGFACFVRQRYRRFYVALDRGFEAYVAGFSSSSRSTLRRKSRRLAERCGGTLDVRHYTSPAEVDEFHRHARAVSALTYQERLLDDGLPEGEEALATMRDLAARGSLRGWILFIDGRPASYLYAPAEGGTLVYAHLGYDPDHAALSPGIVLQFEALRQLMEEGRFALFDFTEGEGQHKRQFATGSVECVDLLLLRPTFSNRLAGHALSAFDRAVALAKSAVVRLGLEGLVRSLRR